MNMKFFFRFAKFSFIFITICSLYSSLVHASYSDEWLRKQKEADEKYMNELEKDGNLTQEAIDSISKGSSKRKPVTRSKQSKTQSKQDNTSGNTTESSKGWVFSSDELHIINLPEDPETGYTKSGWYGNP